MKPNKMSWMLLKKWSNYFRKTLRKSKRSRRWIFSAYSLHSSTEPGLDTPFTIFLNTLLNAYASETLVMIDALKAIRSTSYSKRQSRN